MLCIYLRFVKTILIKMTKGSVLRTCLLKYRFILTFDQNLPPWIT